MNEKNNVEEFEREPEEEKLSEEKKVKKKPKRNTVVRREVKRYLPKDVAKIVCEYAKPPDGFDVLSW